MGDLKTLFSILQHSK